MSKRVIIIVTALAVTVAVPAACGAGSAKPVKNVIVMIDDGAGYNQHEAGSLYDTGSVDGEVYNAFPYTSAVSTYSYGDVAPGECADLNTYDPQAAWATFAWVLDDPTDSAAAATAMATGIKTYDAAIGVDCAGQPVENVVEAAEKLGKATGVVTTVPFSHATPAGFVAHETQRDEFEKIAVDMIRDSATDVIMGGGHPYFSQSGAPVEKPGYKFIGESEYADLKAGVAGADADGDGTPDPFTLIETQEAFKALAAGDTPKRVFGLAPVRRTLQEDRASLDTTWQPYEKETITTTPALAEMVNGALNVLDNDPDGFFVMIEGGATDWAAHDSQLGLLIEEELAFDRAVDAVVSWVDTHSSWNDTMLVVTSDHETGLLNGPDSGVVADSPVWNPLVSNGKGTMPDGDWHTVGHTNSLVPIWVQGEPGKLLSSYVDGTDPKRGAYIDNTDIHSLILAALGAPTQPEASPGTTGPSATD